MIHWNAERVKRGEEAVEFGIALHAGDVMYGNFGATNRLDFTAIGPAVNLTSRIEGLCRHLGPNILISDTFAKLCTPRVPLRSLGMHLLADIAHPVEHFTID